MTTHIGGGIMGGAGKDAVPSNTTTSFLMSSAVSQEVHSRIPSTNFRNLSCFTSFFLVRSDSRDLEIKSSDALARNATAAALTRLDEFVLAENLCVHWGIVGGGGSGVCGRGWHIPARKAGRNTQGE